MSGMVKTKPLAVPGPKLPVGRAPVGYTPPQPEKLAPLPSLIKQQPLPVTNTDQYNQTQAMYAQALAQLQASQQAQLAMQAQLNRMSATDPTAGLMKRMMGQFQGDPFAAERARRAAQEAEMYRMPNRMSTAWMGQGY